MKDYKEYKNETTVIEAFEEYIESLNCDYGDDWEDFGEWFLCFRAGFEAGGCNG